jgi:predicted transcriptional regulator
MTDHGMSPDEYRAKWGLKSDYPMANYSAKRRELAKKIGLGRKPRAPEPVPAAAPATPRSRRKVVA